MPVTRFEQRRGQIETYFDKTASKAWSVLTSDEKLGHIRRTVRAGRDSMRAMLLDYISQPIEAVILDAGSGTGALAGELAKRGANVTGIDLSKTLVDLARYRAPNLQHGGRLRFLVGDMTDPLLGRFDYVVAMDSLIHYAPEDALRVLAGFAARTERSILFTFAPATLLLSAFHLVGKLLPRGNRSPAIVPVAENRLCRMIESDPAFGDWRIGRSNRISSGFYTSQAMELVRR